jgi:regulator of sirC expression with transglutaminase-like and TPR domain
MKLVDFSDRDAAGEFLRTVGRLPGERLPIAETALALAAYSGSGLAAAAYRDHLDTLAADLAGAGNGLAAAIEALQTELFQRHGYAGDSETYDDPQNADLMRVIDRRKGLPVALGILAIHAARAQGWEMAGLALPGHFLVRLDVAGERAILDPFDGARRRDVAELRALLRSATGTNALEPRHYAPVGDRDVLLRLQNNLKLRYLEKEAPAKALAVLDGMILIAPELARLRHEAGILHAELGNYGAATAALKRCLDLPAEPGERQRAALLLQELRMRLN